MTGVKNMNKIAILINTRDRPTELALLLQSLRTQTTSHGFDIFILEDCSGSTIWNYHFLTCLINKLNNEGKFVHFERTPFNYGVSKARQRIVEMANEGKYDYYLRVDDDVILEADYIDKLFEVIDQGYDLASGVTPFIGQAQFKRESKFIQPVGNRVILDKEGNFIFNGDDCGMLYHDEAILPLHHFRSCALYKAKIHDKVSYESNLTKHGFREEEIFSFKCIKAGFKLGMHTQAIAWHLLTPSGGERFVESQEMIKTNEQVLRDFTKKLIAEGNFIEEYNKSLGITVNMPSQEELIKPTNLVRI